MPHEYVSKIFHKFPELQPINPILVIHLQYSYYQIVMLEVKTETIFWHNKVEELYSTIHSIEIIDIHIRCTHHASYIKKAKQRTYFYDVHFLVSLSYENKLRSKPILMFVKSVIDSNMALSKNNSHDSVPVSVVCPLGIQTS